MINSIELKNWKTHKDTKLKFSRGTNILLGQMGAGKSSIMDAISFALFGTYPAIQHKRVAVDEIIMNRPEQKKQASVSLEFGIDGSSYLVQRNLELNGSSKATISKNGTYLQSQPQRVNEEVERILKVDYDLFSRAVYAEQNRLTYFLELRPSERKKQIDELLGLDKFAMAQDNATTLINKIKDMVAENEKTISTFDIKKLREQHQAMLDEIAKLKKARKELEGELKVYEKGRIETEGRLKDAKEQYNKRTLLTKEIAELRSKLDFIEKEIEKIREKGVTDRNTLEKHLTAAKNSFESAKKAEKEASGLEKAAFQEVAHLEADTKSIGKELEEREKLMKEMGKQDKKGVESGAKKKSEELKALKEECDANIASANENRKWLSELEKHLSKCPICERELSGDMRERILAEKRSAIKALDAKVEKQKQGVEKIEKEVDAYKKELDAISRIEEKLSGYSDVEKRAKAAKEELGKAKEGEQKLKKKMEEAGETASGAKDALAKLEAEKENAERIERYAEEKEKSSKALKEKEGSLSKISVNEEQIDRMQSEYTKINVQIKEVSTKLDANAAAEKEKDTQAEEKKKEIELIDKMHEEVKRKKRTVENIVKFKQALEETQTTLRTKLIGSINEIMQEIWPELYPYADYQSLLLEPTAEDYVLKVKTSREENNGWENVEAIASGGEKSVACLAMRVAFALVLVPNLKWIILDEPTHNIDQQGLGKFVKAINEVLPRLVEQVFIITHDEMLKQVPNARIYVLSRNKEESGETKVEAY